MFDDIKAWPFQEARKILARLNGKIPEKGYVLFETGYGPSGLPHIGTFAEVVRTTMVRQAFHQISNIPTKLVVFSDDRDGLRKVPDNISNQGILEKYLGYALTSVPDPFNSYKSFGEHNNAMLRRFLNSFKFDYEFRSATEWYNFGRFDHMLLAMAEHYEEIQNIMLPTLGKDRRESYSIFMPVTADGQVLQVPIIKVDPSGILVYKDEQGNTVESAITGTNVKLQWKADWAGRWYAFDVDYEMFGKDLIPTAELSRKINKVIGGIPPSGFNYELFLDNNGEKISKSKGNGFTIEEWLKYGSAESLVYYLYQTPQRAKKLAHNIVPRCVDDYHAECARYNSGNVSIYENAVWYVHKGECIPHVTSQVTYNLLLNLIGTINTNDRNIILEYLDRYTPGISSYSYIPEMVDGAIGYYEKYIKGTKTYRIPTEHESRMLKDLSDVLSTIPDGSSDEAIQAEIYEVGKRNYASTELRMFFKAVYEILLGQVDGPRMGAFVNLYGRQNTVNLISNILKGN